MSRRIYRFILIGRCATYISYIVYGGGGEAILDRISGQLEVDLVPTSTFT